MGTFGRNLFYRKCTHQLKKLTRDLALVIWFYFTSIYQAPTPTLHKIFLIIDPGKKILSTCLKNVKGTRFLLFNGEPVPLSRKQKMNVRSWSFVTLTSDPTKCTVRIDYMISANNATQSKISWHSIKWGRNSVRHDSRAVVGIW